MQTLLNVVHITTCVLLILIVLIQSGKGAEISASFGGSSQTVFGSSGGANFFTRLTTILAGIFMLTSVTLTMIANREKKSVFEGQKAEAPAETTAPAQPAEAASAKAPAEAEAQTPSKK
jgi:preprotein translocase subunit SecG